MLTLQVCKSASLQVCKSASLQVCKPAVCKSASLQSASVARRKEQHEEQNEDQQLFIEKSRFTRE